MNMVFCKGVYDMPAELIQHKDNTLTVQFTVTLTGHMLEDEQSLQDAVNDAGCIAMAPMIKQFDTNGEPIRINGIKHTAKQISPEIYETPYGPVKVERRTYQTSKGGRSYVPLENDARMVFEFYTSICSNCVGQVCTLWS
jgi:hypothetical protein